MKQVNIFMLNEATNAGGRLAIDHHYLVDEHVAKRLEEEGKAIITDDVTDRARYNREIGNLVGRFKKDYEKLENSKDPRYKDPDFFAEKTNELKAELDEAVKKLQDEYAANVASLKQTAEEERANLTRTISPTDKTGAEQLVNELVTIAKLNGIKEAIDRIESDIPYYSEGRRFAIAHELHKLVDIVPADDKTNKSRLRRLFNDLSSDEDGVMLASRMAKALDDSVGYSYNTLKLTHRSYRGRR